MRTGSIFNMTYAFSIVSFSVILLISFSAEALAKRGCAAFGHSCYGGHGKRSNPDDPKQTIEIFSRNNELSDSSNDIRKLPIDDELFQRFQDLVHRRNRDSELSRHPRDNDLPIFIGKWLTSNRQSHNAHSLTDD